MPRLHVTRQGETVDLACWLFYGRTWAVIEAVLAANPGLAAMGPILPMGTTIIMPDAPSADAARKLVSLWD